VPCHRVVRADGKVGDYNRGGWTRKLKLLKEEGAL
jgi:O6-methylguanine-DNA--protein-cysteine methyltransferase